MKVQKKGNQICHGFLLFLLALALAAGVPAGGPGSMSLKAGAKETKEDTEKKKETRKGWKGNKYYKNGKYLTGMQKISGKYYYFGSKGNKKTSYWYTDEKGRTYYFNKKGVRVSGIKKISGKYYYFRSNGAQLTSDKKIDGVTYYVDLDGYLEAYAKTNKAGNIRFYTPDGTKMTKAQRRVMETLQDAEDIVSEVTTKSDTKSQKLEKCFRWVMSHPYRDYKHFSSTWYCDYAEDHFQRHGGDCRGDACAFAFLAKALGYEKVYVIADGRSNPPSGCHCWCEINGKVYDPLFAESKSFSKYYNGTYTPGSSGGANLWRITEHDIFK